LRASLLTKKAIKFSPKMYQFYAKITNFNPTTQNNQKTQHDLNPGPHPKNTHFEFVTVASFQIRFKIWNSVLASRPNYNRDSPHSALPNSSSTGINQAHPVTQ
jgi:hypothetical protein